MTTALLVHRYEPHGTCKTLFRAKAEEVLLSGPAGTGKSRACLEKLNAQALKYAGMRGLIVRKTAATLGSTALVTWRTHVIPELLEAGQVTYYGGSAQEPPQFRYSNGSVICIAGMDKASKVMSSEYDAIYVQEATELTEDDWEKLTTRLRNGVMPYQQLIADANPDVPHHWLKRRCERGDTVMVNTRHTDNPVLYRDGALTAEGQAYLGKLARLTGVRRLRLEKGLWVAAEGLIYDTYDPTVHLIDRFDIPDDWTRFWVVDFGFTNPFVMQWWAEDPDGRLYLYREIYRTRTLVEDHARHALKLVTREDGSWKEPRPRAVICDHDAEDRATLEKHLGIPTVAATKTVSDGLQAAQARFTVQGDGKPRVFLLRDSLVEKDETLDDAKRPICTDQEIVGYVWDTTPGKPPKETPVKENDHGMDCFRYVVAHRDLGSTPRADRWF
jgi:PBSX family phage terminase large subunit